MRFVDEGYTAVKASIGRGNIEPDLAGVEAVCEAVAGKADVLVDAHGAYASDLALEAGKRLQAMGVYWLEDALPPEDIAGYVRLAAALDMLVVGGETECTRWQVQERLQAGAFDAILPDVCRAGGISEGRRIADVARLHNRDGRPTSAWVVPCTLRRRRTWRPPVPNFLIFEFPSTPNPLGDVLLTGTAAPGGRGTDRAGWPGAWHHLR